jgi:hypothetical protein
MNVIKKIAVTPSKNVYRLNIVYKKLVKTNKNNNQGAPIQKTRQNTDAQNKLA